MIRQLILIFVVVVLGACSVGKPYQRPNVVVPESFRGAEASLAQAMTLPTLTWWDLYQDSVLQALMNKALTQNYDIKIALARVDQYRALAGVSNLNSIPLISAGGVATRNRYSRVNATPLPSSIPAINQAFTPGISASYEVDFWHRISSLQDSARAQLLSSEYAQEVARIAVLSNVATSYFNLCALDAQLAVTQKTLASRESFVQLTRAQLNRGVVSELDFNRAEASLALTKASIEDLNRQIIQAENLLQVLLGENPGPILRPSNKNTVAGTAILPQPPAVPIGLPSSLLERRPDLRLAESDLVSSNAQLRAVKASLFPIVSLTGSFGSSSSSLVSLFTGPARVWSFGFNLLQPVIDPSRNIFQIKGYTAVEQQVLLAYQQAVIQAFREVADAIAARTSYSQSLQIQADQVKSLEVVRSQVVQRYEAGYSSYFEVIDADNALYAAQLSQIDAHRNTLNALTQLYKALGGGWDNKVQVEKVKVGVQKP